MWNTALWLSYSEELLTVRSAETMTTSEIVERRLTGNLSAQVGIAGRLALALDVPLVLWQEGEAAPLRDGGGDIPHTALGDPRLTARVRLLGEGSDVDRERAEGFGLAMLGAVTAPIGSDDAKPEGASAQEKDTGEAQQPRVVKKGKRKQA